MAIERAHVRAVQKPWGSLDLRPWGTIPTDNVAVGELWYERPGDDESRSRLLLKVLVTEQQLSIQVHPDDSYARSMGLPGGKTEAWYILSADPGAKVATGLKKRITSAQLRRAIDDGSVANLVDWRPVARDDVIFVPAGTIHAIGPGLAIAEIQQRSDTTFRVFDYGRGRELHVDDAIAVANPGPAQAAPSLVRLTDARTLLVVDSHFVLERVDLLPGSSQDFRAEKETWLLVLRGGAQVGSFALSVADVILLEGEQVRMDVSDQGLRCLVAYPGPRPALDLLCDVNSSAADRANPRPAGSLLHQPGSIALPLQRQHTQS